MAENKKKLTLDDLKVQSFVTTLSEEQQLAVRGGVTYVGPACTGGTDCGTDTATECTSLVYCDNSDGGFHCDSSNCYTGYTCY